MINFINAKINLGLNIIRKREDGYHDLESAFYPVGIYNGTPLNPEPFGDIIEIHLHDSFHEDEFIFLGNPINCSVDKNLVVKAVRLFDKELAALPNFRDKIKTVTLFLEKHIPDQAGLGGGSADASFTLKMLNEYYGHPFNNQKLQKIASELGADCPFFILNRPSLVTGIGDKIQPLNFSMEGKWGLLVKPDCSISTKEAFENIKPKKSDISIQEILNFPISEWEDRGLKNEFEKSFFAKYPSLTSIKKRLYEGGALYASMSGSGSSFYGIFTDKDMAKLCSQAFKEQTFLVRL